MSRLIDAEYLLDLIKDINDGERYGYIDAEDINNAPTADAVPVRHGHWEKVDTRGYLSPGGTPTVRCSNCKDRRTEHLSGVEYPEWRNFCPVCGALMDEVVES